MNKCEGCLKPCENNPDFNPDQECWQPPTLYQLAVLGGEKIVKLIEQQNELRTVPPPTLPGK